jgi:hypothetical protein
MAARAAANPDFQGATMKRLSRLLGAAAVWAVALAEHAPAEPPQHCKLELVRLAAIRGGIAPADFRYYQVSPQGFRWDNVATSPRSTQARDYDRDDPRFTKAVVKEPKQYTAARPLRGVAKLGSKEYGFVLDHKDKKSKGYDRLYFDLHGNGDLTDAKPIDAQTPASQPAGLYDGLAATTFPRVDLTIDVDGKKLDYSFFLQLYAYPSANGRSSMVVAWLRSAVYRRGEMMLGGKKQKVVVLDANSNGRFDDVTSIRKDIRGAGGQIFPSLGDVLWIEEERAAAAKPGAPPPAIPMRIQLSKVNLLGGKFYQLKVSPTGDELTCAPCTLPMGKITSPHAPCTVELAGDLGVVSLPLEKSQPAEIMAGQWRLVSYTLTVKDWKEPSKHKAAKGSGGPSLADALAKAVLDALFADPEPVYGPPAVCVLSAQGTMDGKPVSVGAGETTTLAFGPPYKPRVTVGSAGDMVYLGMALAGAEGERVTNLVLNGHRPEKPKITITGPEDKVVAEGTLEYG